MNHFLPIDAEAYFEEQNHRAFHYRKVGDIEARQGRVGEVIKTIASGIHETTRTVENPDQWVIRNKTGEVYLVGADTLAKKYVTDGSCLLENTSDGPVTWVKFSPKGVPTLAVRLREDVTFETPRGGPMNILRGGYLMYGGPKDIYGINPEEFQKTYAPCDREGNLDVFYKKLYSFHYEVQRMGCLEGLFVASERDVADCMGRSFSYSDILGKHSEIYDDLSEEMLTVKSEDPEFIKKLVEIIGGELISGINPLENIWDRIMEE